VFQLLVTANVPNSLIIFTLMMEATCSFETSVLIRTTRRHIPEDGILHSHRRENLRSHIGIKMFLGSRAGPVCEANLTDICEAFFLTEWVPEHFMCL
jgi:hypothetical protein